MAYHCLKVAYHCLDMFLDVYVDVCVDVCVDMCVDMCVDVVDADDRKKGLRRGWTTATMSKQCQ